MKRSLDRLLASRLFRYALAGAGTTLVNFGAFALLTWFSVDYVLANTAAFAVSVAFAFVVNERYVFQVKSTNARVLGKRWLQFVVLRVSSYASDMGLMLLLVGVLEWDALVGKISVNFLVIAINYAVSKYYIFRTQGDSP
jgi:Predicted membrane protein